jgi:hypothetical protein
MKRAGLLRPKCALNGRGPAAARVPKSCRSFRLRPNDRNAPISVISRMATIDTKRSFQMRFSGAALHCLRAVRAQVFVGKHVLSYCETLCGIRLAVRMPMPPAVLPTALNVTTILDHYEATPSNHCGQKCPRRWGAAGDHWEGCADSQSSNAGIITVRRYADKSG